MGVGKTLIGLRHMQDQFEKGAKSFMVVAPKLSIFETWKEDAYKFGLEHLLIHIKFTTYLSLTKQHVEYDCIYLDECHNLLYTHENYLLFYHGDILGLTGTPPRHANSEKGIMMSRYCPISYEYVTDDAIVDNILNDYRIVVHLLPLETKKTYKVSKKNGGSFMTSERDHYNYWTNNIDKQFSIGAKQKLRIMRMQGLMQYPTKEKYAKHLLTHVDDKCIVFCNNTDQADRVCENSYHSKNSNSESNLEEFKQGKFKCLSAVQQLNEGVNIPNLKYGIILHAYSNERKSNQRIGRLLRLNPDQQSIIHILAYKDTVDTEWVLSALGELDQSKITWKNAEYNG
jgi:superfamily II DNA or RNA helicase